jgi:hypothetical protein
VTSGRFAALGASLVLLAVLLVPVVEGVLRLHGATAWIAVAGLFTIVGGGLAIVGAILNSAEQKRMVLGADDTFCQLTVYIDRDGPGWFLSTLHAGPGGPIYDSPLQHGIRKMSEHQRWFEAGCCTWPRCGRPCRRWTRGGSMRPCIRMSRRMRLRL